MQRTIYQYEPRRKSPDIAIGVKLPFNKGGDSKPDTNNYASGSIGGRGVFNLSYSTEEQAISNLKNLLLTRKGERYMQPSFGTDIYDFIFSQNTAETVDTLVQSIQEDINFWLPYIVVKSLQSYQENNELQLRLEFSVTENGANLVILIFADENVVAVSDTTNAELVLTPVINGVY